MTWTKEQIALGKQLHLAIRRGQVELVTRLCHDNPLLVCDHDWSGYSTWIETAARYGRLEVIGLMLELGFNVNALDVKGKTCALVAAIDESDDAMIDLLLASGADPNLGRSMIASLSVEDESRRKRYLRRLVEYGADVNQIYDLYGDLSNGFTALDWAARDPDSAEYLRQHGALTTAEIRRRQELGGRLLAAEESGALTDAESEVVEYFRQNF